MAFFSFWPATFCCSVICRSRPQRPHLLPAPALAVRHSLTSSAPACAESGSHNKNFCRFKATHLHSILQISRRRLLRRHSRFGPTHSFVTRSLQHQQPCLIPISSRCLSRQCSSNCRRLDRYCHMLDPDDPNYPSWSASAIMHFSLGLHCRPIGERPPPWKPKFAAQTLCTRLAKSISRKTRWKIRRSDLRHGRAISWSVQTYTYTKLNSICEYCADSICMQRAVHSCVCI